MTRTESDSLPFTACKSSFTEIKLSLSEGLETKGAALTSLTFSEFSLALFKIITTNGILV